MTHGNEELGLRPVEGQTISWGKSRGGMGGNGKLALASYFDRNFVGALHEDPCLLHPTGLRETLGGVTPIDVAHEMYDLRHALRRLHDESQLGRLSRLACLRNTLGASSSYAKIHAQSGRAIWRGDAGLFLRHLPLEQGIVTVMMNRNDLNHRQEYGEHLAYFPNARIIDRNYWHLGMARPDVVMAGVDALATGVQLAARGEHQGLIAQVMASHLELQLPDK